MQAMLKKNAYFMGVCDPAKITRTTFNMVLHLNMSLLQIYSN